MPMIPLGNVEEPHFTTFVANERHRPMAGNYCGWSGRQPAPGEMLEFITCPKLFIQ